VNKISGVYCIENILDGKKYIGKSINMDSRWKDHRWLLKNNKHGNDYLQNSYNIHGEENFKFWIVQEIDNNNSEVLILMETYWIVYYNSHIQFGRGYNLTFGQEGINGCVYSEQTRQKMSKSQSGENNPNFGKTTSDETKSKISKSLMGREGRKHSQETRDKISKGNKDKKCTDESKERMSKGQMGNKNSLGIHRSEKTKNSISTTLLGMKKAKNPSSQYHGVTKDKKRNNWMVYIGYNKKSLFIGNFKYETEAALAYNMIALELYGWKAKLNLIVQEEIDALWEMD
jgi:group I intron endonuclease